MAVSLLSVSNKTTSVKVPPTSTPINFIGFPPRFFLAVSALPVARLRTVPWSDANVLCAPAKGFQPPRPVLSGLRVFLRHGQGRRRFGLVRVQSGFHSRPERPAKKIRGVLNRSRPQATCPRQSCEARPICAAHVVRENWPPARFDRLR